ncbi:maleylpyruvate isomerase family mycothiol-dependent enzyme [Spongiactinospora sp. TRM90649]|uniref:maleylpyruvate isomerase family mycothiol-dependent enzyme n=1 Tax=Spongiactinospora sp. TRM90649 TaxID=3031114 RepID=UPI0023F9942A|nr:maleylpyruvate isomerase family mycothiol-dependent enzyme [Spongiactinospora sp. TRM90649]MDF5755126.1 maleylpyruvate isomerase family mycothiol-dependent enzyme [Spongiactinospora sp. TRM90649]
MTIFGPVIDVRPLFPDERRALLELLRELGPRDWARATVCPGWDVHDIAGHVLNDYTRRLSGSRDGYAGARFADGETLPRFLERVNGEFVRATRQISPELLIELLEHLGPGLDAVWASHQLEAPAGLDVSWAATDLASPAWLDIGREYTEFWVHQQQIRDAVGRPGADEPVLMTPVLEIFARALPQSLREHDRSEGTTAELEVLGAAGGRWSATPRQGRWHLTALGGEPEARVTMDQDTFWRLATRGITVEQARSRSRTTGDPELTAAMTALLAVVA